MSEEQRHPRKALVVLGMHRSGTSAMTRVLGLCGAALPREPLEAGFANPEGFWEPKGVVALNDEILTAFDSSWDDVFAGRPKHYLSNFDRVYLHKAEQALDIAFGDADLIAIKDPRINVLAAFWDRALRTAGYEPTYVIMVRHPLEVAASLRQRDKISTEAGVLLWLDNMCAAERDTRGAKRLFIAYPDLLDGWKACVDRIETIAGLPLPRRTPTAANAIGQFLNNGLRHHQVGPHTDSTFANDFPKADAAYAWFLTAAREGEPPDTRSLDDADRHLVEMDIAVGPVLADLRSQASALRDHLGEYRKHTDGLEAVVAALRGELEEHARRLLDSAHVKDAAHAEAAELRRHAEALEAERTRLTQMLEEAAARETQTNGERDALRRHAEALEVERVRLEAALASALDREQRAEASLQDLERQLELERTQIEAERARFAEETERARDRPDGQALEQALRAQADAKTEAEYLRRRHDGLRSELERLIATSEASRSRSHAAERDLAQAHAERDRALSDLDGLHRTLADERRRFDAELAELRARAETAERSRDAVETEAKTAIADLVTQREAMLASTSWRLTSAPRRLLSLLRG